MCRRIAIVLLILLNALMPALSIACATSCAIGGSGMDVPQVSDQGTDDAGGVPCHGDTQSPDESGSGTGGAELMAAMCAFAATAAISSAHLTVDPGAPFDHIAFIESNSPSFISLPADKPPRT